MSHIDIAPCDLNQQALAARRGDPKAIARLCEYFYPKVYRYMLNRTARREDAEDLAGDVCIRVLTSLPKQTGFFPAWVFRIAANLVFDTHRRGTEWREVQLPEDAPESSSETRKEGGDILPHQVDRVLRTLTADQRDVVYLRFVEGFEVNEIAEILAKSPGAVRALQFRALESLRKALAAEPTRHKGRILPRPCRTYGRGCRKPFAEPGSQSADTARRSQEQQSHQEQQS